jgi:hypothetical protein
MATAAAIRIEAWSEAGFGVLTVDVASLDRVDLDERRLALGEDACLTTGQSAKSLPGTDGTGARSWITRRKKLRVRYIRNERKNNSCTNPTHDSRMREPAHVQRSHGSPSLRRNRVLRKKKRTVLQSGAKVTSGLLRFKFREAVSSESAN